MRAWVTWVGLVLLGLSYCACLDAPLVDCGDETACPQDTICAKTIVSPQQGEIAICPAIDDLARCKDQAVAASCGENSACVMTTAGMTCVENVCGDSLVSGVEQCDDGNLTSGDGCSRDCASVETCGNDTIDGINAEQCDDGVPGLSGDGCSSSCTVEAEVWLNVEPLPTQQRTRHAMAYDSARGEVVVFGGLIDGVANAETYEFNGTRWRSWRGLNGPPILASPTMAYDRKRKRVVLIGHQLIIGALNETWEFDGVSWVAMNAELPQRDGQAMTYDSVRERCLVFGGDDSHDIASNELWEYAGQQWRKVETGLAPTPQPRAFAAMAFDQVRDKVVVFGGRSDAMPNDIFADTWEFDGAAWQLRTLALAPPGRQEHTLYFDSVANKVVLFAGNSATNPLLTGPSLNDIWEFDGNAWTVPPLIGIAPPLPRDAHAMVFNDDSGEGILFGGEVQGEPDSAELVWAVQGQPTRSWAKRSPTPRNRFLAKTGHSYTFDSLRGSLVVFGGQVPAGGTSLEDNSTWEFTDAGWSLMPALNPPPKQFGQVMAYDSRRRVIVMFGRNAETWELANATWTKRAVTGPPARTRAAMSYDIDRGVILMVGGVATVAPFMLLADTWEFDGTTWTERASVATRSGLGLVDHSLVYDWHNHKTVLIGGFTDLATTNPNTAVFDFDGAAWLARSMINSLPVASTTSATYDVIGSRILVVSQQRTLVLAAHEWQTLTPISALRANQTLASLHYDSTHRRVLAFLQFTHPVGTGVFSYGFSSSIVTSVACNSTADTDGDGLVGCGDNLDPQDPLHNADPDCFGWCFPTCPPPSLLAERAGVCDPTHLASAPHCGDGVCNAILEDYLICPTDCERL